MIIDKGYSRSMGFLISIEYYPGIKDFARSYIYFEVKFWRYYFSVTFFI